MKTLGNILKAIVLVAILGLVAVFLLPLVKSLGSVGVLMFQLIFCLWAGVLITRQFVPKFKFVAGVLIALALFLTIGLLSVLVVIAGLYLKWGKPVEKPSTDTTEDSQFNEETKVN